MKTILPLLITSIIFSCSNSQQWKQVTDVNQKFEISIPQSVDVKSDSPNEIMSVVSFKINSDSYKEQKINYLISWEKSGDNLEVIEETLRQIDNQQDYELVDINMNKIDESEILYALFNFHEKKNSKLYEVRQFFVKTKNKEGIVIFSITNESSFFNNVDSIAMNRIVKTMKRK